MTRVTSQALQKVGNGVTEQNDSSDDCTQLTGTVLEWLFVPDTSSGNRESLVADNRVRQTISYEYWLSR